MAREAATRPAEPVSESTLKGIRVPFVQRASFTYEGGSEELFIVDLGLRGIYVERAEPFRRGLLVEARFPLPGNAIPLLVRCRVAWSHTEDAPLVSKWLPPGSGLEFVELSERDSERVRTYLLEYLRRHPRARRFARQWPTRFDDDLADGT